MTRLLALETTERPGSVAAAENGRILCQIQLDPNQRTTQSIAWGVQQVLHDAGWHPQQVQLVTCCIGPGSFTGLRVGVTMAKTFAYCVGADVLGVDTLEVIAATMPEETPRFWVAMDAQRQQVVCAQFYRADNGFPQFQQPASLESIDAWLSQLPAGSVITGPALRKLADRLPPGIVAAPPQCWSPTAASLAQVAFHHYTAGRRDQVWTLQPRYIRPSYAEEKFPQGGPWPNAEDR